MKPALKTLRIIIAGSGLAGTILCGIVLPFLGFGLGGITAGSFAASIQGPAVVAGSMFAVLQSLGATGMGILFFLTPHRPLLPEPFKKLLKPTLIHGLF